MPTLINTCVFLSRWFNWADAPDGGRAWKTNIGGGVDGSEQRQGLRAAAYRSQSGRLTAGTLLKRVGLEDEILAAMASGRAAAPRVGWGSAVLAGTTTTVDIADTVPIAALDYVCLRISGAAYARQVTAIATPSSGVRRLTVATLPAAPATGDRVWPMLFGRLTASKIRSLDGARWDLQVSIEEPLGTGTLGTSDSCTPAALVNTGAGLNLCGLPTDMVADQSTDCGLVAATLRWSEVFAAQSYNVYRSTASMGARTLVDTVGGDVFSYEVPRSSTGYYYVVTAVTGAHESDESAEVHVPPTTIEGVMRAVQERLLARADATHGLSPVAIVWPNRSSDGLAPGTYPADYFYSADIISGGAGTAAALVVLINDAILDAWLDSYATTGTWTGIASVDDIPRWTRLGLDIPDSATINAGNWEANLFALAGAVCQLEHLVREADVVDSADRAGVGKGFRYDMQSEDLSTTTTYAACFGAAGAAWNAVQWSDEGSVNVAVVEVLNVLGYTGGSGAPYGVASPGVFVAQGTFDGASSYQRWWSVALSATRAKIEVDLAPASTGTARLWLVITGGLDMARPVVAFDSLQPWITLSPGAVVATPYLTGTNAQPSVPDGFGGLVPAANLHHAAPPQDTLADLELSWSLVEQAVCWTRSHDPALGHWTYYP